MRRRIFLASTLWAALLVFLSFTYPIVTGSSGRLSRSLVDVFGLRGALPAVACFATTVIVASVQHWGRESLKPTARIWGRSLSVGLLLIAYGLLALVPHASLLLVPLGGLLVLGSFLPDGATIVRKTTPATRS